MDDRMKLKLAIADAMIEQLWKKGILTLEERDRITEATHADMLKCAA